jgi:hypothetical protein
MQVLVAARTAQQASIRRPLVREFVLHVPPARTLELAMARVRTVR